MILIWKVEYVRYKYLKKILFSCIIKLIKRDSKPYWFAPIWLFYIKTTVVAIQWFFHAYFLTITNIEQLLVLTDFHLHHHQGLYRG